MSSCQSAFAFFSTFVGPGFSLLNSGLTVASHSANQQRPSDSNLCLMFGIFHAQYIFFSPYVLLDWSFRLILTMSVDRQTKRK